MQKLSLFIFFIIFFSNANAQKDTTYYSYYNVKLDQDLKEKAAFYELNSGQNRNGRIERFYPTHEPYGFANYSENQVSGPIITLFKNGNIREQGQYLNGNKSGDWVIGHSNGQAFATIKYDDESDLNYPYTRNIADSTGTLIVIDGNGKYKGPDPLNRKITIEGEYQHGWRIGKWTSYKDERLLDEEIYDSFGKLESGKSWDEEGNAYHYSEIEEQAQHKGGMEGWFKHLRKTFRYPSKAVRNGIEGDVDVSFIVGKQGELENIEIINGIGHGCDKEAIRVIKKSNWEPGKQKGQPVKSKMKFRVSFRLR